MDDYLTPGLCAWTAVSAIVGRDQAWECKGMPAGSFEICRPGGGLRTTSLLYGGPPYLFGGTVSCRCLGYD